MVNSKRKGKAGELEVANMLKTWGFAGRRTAQYNGKEQGSLADVIGLPGIHIEVKRVEKLNIYEAIDQAVRDSKESEIPTVWHRKNNHGWLITMQLPDWMEMYLNSALFDKCLMGDGDGKEEKE